MNDDIKNLKYDQSDPVGENPFPDRLSVPVATVLASVREWEKDHKGQRLGQWLMNNLLPKETNPKIFYETDTKKALGMFLSTYE